MKKASRSISAVFRRSPGYISWDCPGNLGAVPPSSGVSGMMPGMWRTRFPYSASTGPTVRQSSSRLHDHRDYGEPRLWEVFNPLRAKPDERLPGLRQGNRDSPIPVLTNHLMRHPPLSPVGSQPASFRAQRHAGLTRWKRAIYG